MLPAWVVAGSERRNPPARRGPQRFELEAAVLFGKPIELFQAGGQQRLRTAAITAHIVMERCGQLDDALQEGSLRFRGG